MERKQAKKVAKWVDSPLNTRIRELLSEKSIKIDDFAKILEVSTEAVRLWCTGYARPDLDKLVIIAEILEVSTDYLLGNAEVKSISLDIKETNKKLGLSEEAIKKLSELKNNYPEYVPILNDFLDNYDFWNVLHSIHMYRKFIKEYSQVPNESLKGFPVIKFDIISFNTKKVETNNDGVKAVKELAAEMMGKFLPVFNLPEFFLSTIKDFATEIVKDIAKKEGVADGNN